MVLRVRKNNHTFDSKLNLLLPEYHNFFYRYFKFNGYESQMELLRVSIQFLEGLNSKSFSQRPDYRRSEAEIDISLKEVLLLPDLLSESFSCEIKVNCLIFMMILKHF